MSLRFIDLFAGLGGFHVALKQLGYECVFASEIDETLREIYIQNFPDMEDKTYGDIRRYKSEIPPHDILCAGFPCQPFSKSGSQQGELDETRGTLFREIIEILELHKPEFVMLENVGNFEHHDNGRTWAIVKKSLEELGYQVKGTEHINSGGTGLLSPHHFGYPHTRERFFIVARKGSLPLNPLPKPNRDNVTSLESIVQTKESLSQQDKEETKLSEKQLACINLWNEFIHLIPDNSPIPSFPIWSDEFNAVYPYEDTTPFNTDIDAIRSLFNDRDNIADFDKKDLLKLFPSYARTETNKFPIWKIRFIQQNRNWFQQNQTNIPSKWINDIRTFPPSLRKFEWNCQGGVRDIWQYVLQFRPSGLRVKRYTSSPALVAMTTTQIPILGPEKRFITKSEGLKLQGFPETHQLPKLYKSAFHALGNAVHVGVILEIASSLILSTNNNMHNNTDIPEKIDDLPLFAHHAINI